MGRVTRNTICWRSTFVSFHSFLSFCTLGAFLALSFRGVALPVSLALAFPKLPLQPLHLCMHALELAADLGNLGIRFA